VSWSDILSSDHLWVALIGALVGITELVSRYRDNPGRALLNFPAALYISFNICASLAALFLIQDVFPDSFQFGGDATGIKQRVLRIITAGAGSMAFFRSSFFVVRVGNKDVPLGPGIILGVLLEVTDRAVDRARASPRADAVSRIMKDVDFQEAQAALPAYCFAMMQNVSAEEQARFASEISQLAASAIAPPVKSLTLGLALMNLVGDTVLSAAVNSLGPEIKLRHDKRPPEDLVGDLMREVDFARAKSALPMYALTLQGSVSNDDQVALGLQIQRLDAASIAPPIKSLILGLALVNLVGEKVLTASVTALKDDIKVSRDPNQTHR
jgi:hypothetical protein